MMFFRGNKYSTVSTDQQHNGSFTTNDNSNMNRTNNDRNTSNYNNANNNSDSDNYLTFGPPERKDTFNYLAYKTGISQIKGVHVRKAVIALVAMTAIAVVGAIVAASVTALSWAMIPLIISAVAYSIFPLFCAAHKTYYLIAEKQARRNSYLTSQQYSSTSATTEHNNY